MNHLILLHGALGSGEELSLLEKHIKNPGIRVHPFTFNGHGKKGLNNQFGIDGFCDELLEFISKEKIEAPFVFGYSMGGYVALNAALKARGFFSGIITLGTKFNWTREFTSKESNKLKPDFLLEKAPDFVALLHKKHGPGWTNLLSLTANMMFGLQHTHLRFIASLARINIPVCIGRGDKDRMVDEEECLLVQQKIEGASCFVLPNTSHGFEGINHSALAELVVEFIDKHSSTEAQANGSHRVL